MYNLTKCDVCPTQFRVKKVSKIKVGYYKGYSVILNYFECPVCKHIHITKWDTPAVNKWSERVFMAEWNMWIYRKEPYKCEKHSAELEIAKMEVEMIYDEVKRVVGFEFIKV